MFNDSTRKMLFLFAFTLCVITIYTMVYFPNTLFEKVLTYFMGVFTTYIGVKSGSTMPQQVSNNTTPTAPSPLDQLPG